jgi:putative protease
MSTSAPPPAPSSRTEVLAPAGDRPAMEAAVRAGADAVYFGLQAWNARARATNFTLETLAETMAFLHAGGCKGYVALNTLVFDGELPAVEQAIRAAAAAGVDALIVQDLGVARLAQAVAPGLPLHASTQMTCTDAGAVELARSLGARRVVLARELSLEDIAAIRRQTDVELEVFVHGALCISYSGQCLTSEAIGGRSANRGACAQSCRLPYELLVDGVVRELGERAYLLSPEDLEAARLVPALVELGVRSLKIEGRLKGPEYVAATTRLYKEAVAAAQGQGTAPDEEARRTALQMYSRGSGPGFLGGIDHQRLVDGRGCEHRGIEVGQLRGVRRVEGKPCLVFTPTVELHRGDGLVVEGGREGAGELGGRIWRLLVQAPAGRGQRARGGERMVERDSAPAGKEVCVWLGPEVALPAALEHLRGHRVFRSSDPVADKRVKALAAPASTRGLRVQVSALGEEARFEARVELEGQVVTVTEPLVAGELSIEGARAQLGRLGGTGFHLDDVTLALPPGRGLPLSALNRARRALVAALQAAGSHAVTDVTCQVLLGKAQPPQRPLPPAGLFVLCRKLSQARAALAAGADGVYLDLLELTGTGDAFRTLVAEGAQGVGLSPPRVRKPGEEKIDRFLRGLAPAALLVRGLGALHELPPAAERSPAYLAIGDFSLNVSNRISAAEVLRRGADVFTPSFDLDGAQLRALLDGPLAGFAEVVVHHPMPLFHMEHCLIAAELSDGRDHRTCGRPCESHTISLRDRAGHEHPVEADVGCRNTVFHGAAQSAADLVPALKAQGVRRFRIELVREDAAQVGRIVGAYRALLAGTSPPAALWRDLRSQLGPGAGYGVVRGSLRVVG